MPRKCRSPWSVGLVCLLLLMAGRSAAGAPSITTRLLINGAFATCGATAEEDDQVSLLFVSSQSGPVVVTARKGTESDTVVARGTVVANTTYRVNFTAGDTDGQDRTFTVTVTNASGETTSQTCSYRVGDSSSSAAPVVTTQLLVDGAAAECGATVADGSQVGLLVSSDQDGTAVVTIRKGTGTETTLATPTVVAGVTYPINVTAGTADGQMRTFTVTVTGGSGQTATETCAYLVDRPAVAKAPAVTTELQVKGAAATCGATVAAGDRVSLLLTSDQDGTAVVTVRRGTGAETTLATGTVVAGKTYRVNVTAGAADGLPRVVTVTVTNRSGQSTSEICSFEVQAAASGRKR